jgi:hypothetical protein
MRLRPLALLSVAAALELAPGCARDNAESSSFTGGGSQPATSPADSSSTSSSGDTSTSSSGSTSTSSSGSTSTGEDSASTAAASAGTWDVGTSPDFDPTIGCQGKIDFLFVISSHFEMKKYQDRLKAAFPTFVDLLRQDLADFDYQIMVVDAGTSALLGDDCYDCEVMCGACQVPGCPEDYPCGPFVECDVTEGAGVTITANFGASNKRCELATEHRYITTADDATLAESFACIATLGEGPKTPVAAQSMVSAVQPEILSKRLQRRGSSGRTRSSSSSSSRRPRTTEPRHPGELVRRARDRQGRQRGGGRRARDLDDSDLRTAGCARTWASGRTRSAFAETAAHGRFLSVCEGRLRPLPEEGAALALDQCAVLVPQ